MYDKILLYNLTLGYRDVAHCTKKGKTVKTFFFFSNETKRRKYSYATAQTNPSMGSR